MAMAGSFGAIVDRHPDFIFLSVFHASIIKYNSFLSLIGYSVVYFISNLGYLVKGLGFNQITSLFRNRV